MKEQYITPELNLKAFNCPHCHVYSHQDWYYLRAAEQSTGYGKQFEDKKFRVSYCERCGQSTIWHGENIIFPSNSIIEPPNINLPDDIKSDYNEAASILSLSPRGSAALLRLATQKLCKHLGESGKDINILKIWVQKNCHQKYKKRLIALG